MGLLHEALGAPDALTLRTLAPFAEERERDITAPTDILKLMGALVVFFIVARLLVDLISTEQHECVGTLALDLPKRLFAHSLCTVAARACGAGAAQLQHWRAAALCAHCGMAFPAPNASDFVTEIHTAPGALEHSAIQTLNWILTFSLQYPLLDLDFGLLQLLH
jgi:hypothetical protein